MHRMKDQSDLGLDTEVSRLLPTGLEEKWILYLLSRCMKHPVIIQQNQRSKVKEGYIR